VTGELSALADEFWAWRAMTQPVSGDDIPRIERPTGWTPDWSPDAVEQRRFQLRAFERRWSDLEHEARAWPLADQVDYRLIGSALARVHWELDITQGWRWNPQFYVYQTLGAVFEALLPPPPFDTARTTDLVARVGSIPATLAAARANLTDHAIQPFAALAIGSLADVGPRLRSVARELRPLLEPDSAQQLDQAVNAAIAALETFRDWLEQVLPTLPAATAIGRDAYLTFLRTVALMPFTPEQMLAGARQELERAVTFDALEQQRNRGLPPLPVPASSTAQIALEAAGERQLRAFCEEHDLLTFPAWLRAYRNLPLPSYLAPLRGLGVNDDLTSPSRLDDDGVSYIPEPAPDLPYFYVAMARDPRTLIAHEGMHYYQLAMAWAHENPIRRHYYDSGSNEGIGFYAEEMLLQSGLFGDSPRSREIIYSFMRLRALRVEVDIRLALGEISIQQAADHLATRVPMDRATAYDEAVFFASEPGQASSYQVGKLQILAFLADCRRVQGADFTMRSFHDALWKDGNVPIALQRWEVLGLADEIDALDKPGDPMPT
jgi:hypothetical protein